MIKSRPRQTTSQCHITSQCTHITYPVNVDIDLEVAVALPEGMLRPCQHRLGVKTVVPVVGVKWV